MPGTGLSTLTKIEHTQQDIT